MTKAEGPTPKAGGLTKAVSKAEGRLPKADKVQVFQ
jgi:hypothetical protein